VSGADVRLNPHAALGYRRASPYTVGAFRAHNPEAAELGQPGVENWTNSIALSEVSMGGGNRCAFGVSEQTAAIRAKCPAWERDRIRRAARVWGTVRWSFWGTVGQEGQVADPGLRCDQQEIIILRRRPITTRDFLVNLARSHAARIRPIPREVPEMGAGRRLGNRLRVKT
jgi:hypothetical protein